MRSIAGFVAGLVLLGTAIWTVAQRQDQLGRAWEAARGADVWIVVLCVTLPLFNWLFTSGMFVVLNGRYARVGAAEMSALIASAWLLNLLPLRPGLVGRVAYHRRVHGIRVRDSMKVLVLSVGSTGTALVLLLLAVAASGGGAGPGRAGVFILAPALALAAGAAVLRRRAPPSPTPAGDGASPPGASHAWRLPAAVLMRYLDMVVWGVRYWLMFRLLGEPVGVLTAAAITVAAQFAMMTPVQLGLREWVVGGAGALLAVGGNEAVVQGSKGHAAIDAATPALMADVVMRAAELAVVIPLGLVCTAWLWGRLRAATEGIADPGEQPPPGCPIT